MNRNVKEVINKLAANSIVKDKISTIYVATEVEGKLFYKVKGGEALTRDEEFEIDDLCPYESGVALMSIDEVYDAEDECNVVIKTVPVYVNGEILI